MPTKLGKGISEAVRNHIPIWVDTQLIDCLYTEYKKNSGILSKPAFANRVSNVSDWVRKSRRRTDTGWEREYTCKTVQKVTLLVHSPESEVSATGYVFNIDGVPVAGGKTKLKSVDVSKILSKSDKSTSRMSDVHFTKFTEEELRKMRIQMEYGDGLQHLETQREA